MIMVVLLYVTILSNIREEGRRETKNAFYPRNITLLEIYSFSTECFLYMCIFVSYFLSLNIKA